MLSGGDQSLLKPREYFRLEPMQQEFDFISREEFDKNLRYKMIALRNAEHPLFKNYQMIPVFDKELPRDIFKIKDRVMAPYRFASHQKSLQDMVNEDTVPNITILANSILRLSEPRRPLKPVRKERKKVTAQALDGKEVRILINIIRASYIPVRKAPPSLAGTTREGEGRADASDTSNELVCPFIEVMFQRSRVRTRRGEGPNPSFNEELALLLK